MKLSSLVTLVALAGFGLLSKAVDVDADLEKSFQNQCQCVEPEGEAGGVHEIHKRDNFNREARFCKRQSSFGLVKRADGDDGDGNGGIGVGVNLPSVGLSLGNITTKLGNINLTVEDVSIGNISIIVTVPLPGASPIQAFSAFTSGTSIDTSTAAPTSTVTSTSATQPATTSSGFFRQRLARQESGDDGSSTTTSTDASPPTTISLPTATATVGGGPVNLNTGSVDTEIGNITIFVGNVNVSVGDVKIKNITLGNIFVLVQIGQPDLTGALGNLTNSLNGIGDR
ncbi:hypothetical protein V5O48_005213 [Marasmius crinis-equi]|uniref:Uncharacterized protein n=1 Tax=Marasmius crinis-equi TaxID=585013 RepID=A0ABR3FND5_9AGAR